MPATAQSAVAGLFTESPFQFSQSSKQHGSFRNWKEPFLFKTAWWNCCTGQVIHKSLAGIAISACSIFGGWMIGRASPDLSELAYHIIKLCDFWKRTHSPSEQDNGIHVIAAMIGISFGSENSERIARAVVRELDSIRPEKTDDEIVPDGIEVVFISALLHEQVEELPVSTATSYWTSVFG